MCDLFKKNPGLMSAPYRLQSTVSRDTFRDFVSALEDKPIDVKDRNFPGLSHLCEQFDFQALSANRRWPELPDALEAEVRSRISALEKRDGQHERPLATLQSALSSAFCCVNAELTHLASKLEAFQNAKVNDIVGRSSAAPSSRASARPPPAAVLAVAVPPDGVADR
jgi:hypothetical protein